MIGKNYHISVPKTHIPDNILNGVPFVYHRWGDAEWGFVLKEKGRRGDYCSSTQRFSTKIGGMLRQILLRGNLGIERSYMIGTWKKKRLRKLFNGRPYGWLRKRSKGNILFCKSNLLTIPLKQAAHRGHKYDFLDAVQRVGGMIVVGPERFAELACLVELRGFIEIREKNAFRQIDGVEKKLVEMLVEEDEVTVVSISYGVCAPILIDRIYRRIGNKHILLDVGTIWEPFVGVMNRPYHRRIKSKLDRLKGGWEL